MLSEILKKIVEESTNEGIRFIEHTTEVFVSYKELYNDAIGLGEWLKEKGMKPGESLDNFATKPQKFHYNFLDLFDIWIYSNSGGLYFSME